MKKLLLLSIGLFAVNSATAQIKVAAGMTLTDYKAKSPNDYGLNVETKTGTGFYATVSLPINFGEVVYVEPGVGFNTTNTEEDYNLVGIKNTNITIPIEIGARLGDKVRINTGIQGNFVVSAKSTYNEVETDIKDQFKGAYADIMAGITISPTKKIGVTAKYNYSIGSAFEETYQRGMEISKQVISVGLKFSFN